MIFYDIETRADVSVVGNGLRRHAADADLLVVCALVDDEMLTWRAGQTWGHMRPFLDAITAGGWLVAHNEAFDRTVWNAQPDLPKITVEQSIDSAAWMRCFNLPSKLDDLAKRFLGHGKAKAPKHMWNRALPYTDEDMAQQVIYCERDVYAMRDLMALVPTPTRDFLDQYHACARMNDRGCAVDLDLALRAQELKPQVDSALLQDLRRVCGPDIKLRGPSFLRWLETHLPGDLVPLLTVNKKKRDGYEFTTVSKQSADASVRRALLQAIDDRTDCGGIRDALHAFEEANRAAVTKYKAITDVAVNGRVHDQFIFAGAAQTGRASAKGIQLQNTIRDVPPNAEEIIHDIKTAPLHVIEAKHGEINVALSRVVRPTLMGDLTWSDWSAIEARMLPWLSNDAEDVLDVFRAGKDIYVEQARLILNKDDISKEERQTFGKVPVLALGYQGGVNAFQAMARNYGVKIADEAAEEIKTAWRKANAWAVQFWRDAEDAATRAVLRPNEPQPAGRLRYLYAPTVLRGTLLCLLPSGRFIAYPEARIHQHHGLVFLHPTYGPSTTYGGALVQGATQAEAATLLREALARCDSAGLAAVLQVHDEIVVEGPSDGLQEIMEFVPEWASGLPLAAETENGPRYKVKTVSGAVKIQGREDHTHDSVT